MENLISRLAWNDLIELQYNITNEFDRRMKFFKSDVSNTMDNRNKVKQELCVVLQEKIDIAPTKFESFRENSQDDFDIEPLDEPMIPGTLDIRCKLDGSSPLKSSKLSDCDDMNPRIAKIATDFNFKREYVSDSEDEAPEITKSKDSNISNKLNDRVNFNNNPISGKPWIFEDFKVNDDIYAINRGRKKMNDIKLARFYSKAGNPRLNSKDMNDAIDIIIDNDSYYLNEFENLRQRSRSPPGYGRLNFPNTQENLTDKLKSQEIVYIKTKKRFLIATQWKLPIEEREFCFKNSKLNDIINCGKFHWDENKLNIFTRK